MIRNLILTSLLAVATAAASVPADAAEWIHHGPHGTTVIHHGPAPHVWVNRPAPCCYHGGVAAGAIAGMAVGTAIGAAAAARPVPPPTVVYAPPPVVYAPGAYYVP